MKLLPAILIVLTITTSVFAQGVAAQDNTTQEQDMQLATTREKVGKKIKTELALTDNQSRQLQGINESFHSRAKDLRRNSALSTTQKQEQLSQLQQEHNGKVKALLNTDQYEKYQQWTAKRQERWKALKKMQDRQLPGKTTPGKS
jgi:lipopolysaccharide export LptBFGC system permease protein LptF